MSVTADGINSAITSVEKNIQILQNQQPPPNPQLTLLENQLLFLKNVKKQIERGEGLDDIIKKLKEATIDKNTINVRKEVSCKDTKPLYERNNKDMQTQIIRDLGNATIGQIYFQLLSMYEKVLKEIKSNAVPPGILAGMMDRTNKELETKQQEQRGGGDVSTTTTTTTTTTSTTSTTSTTAADTTTTADTTSADTTTADDNITTTTDTKAADVEQNWKNIVKSLGVIYGSFMKLLDDTIGGPEEAQEKSKKIQSFAFDTAYDVVSSATTGSASALTHAIGQIPPFGIIFSLMHMIQTAIDVGTKSIGSGMIAMDPIMEIFGQVIGSKGDGTENYHDLLKNLREILIQAKLVSNDSSPYSYIEKECKKDSEDGNGDEVRRDGIEEDEKGGSGSGEGDDDS